MMKMMYAPEVMEKELASGVHFRVARVDGVPAGYTSWAAYTLPGTAKLHKVYLLQEFQGRGIGSGAASAFPSKSDVAKSQNARKLSAPP